MPTQLSASVSRPRRNGGYTVMLFGISAPLIPLAIAMLLGM